MDYIGAIEFALGMETKNFLPMQDGDVPATYADTSELNAWTGFQPDTSVGNGVAAWFVAWLSPDFRELRCWPEKAVRRSEKVDSRRAAHRPQVLASVNQAFGGTQWYGQRCCWAVAYIQQTIWRHPESSPTLAT